MLKEIAPTPAIISQLKASFGGDVNLNDLAIFEAIALNDQPITKPGSIYNQAVPQLSLLQAMAAYVQNGSSVPLHTLHAQGWELPVGKVFMAEVLNNSELRVLFYLSRSDTTAADLITKLNADIIDEVSVGIMPAKLLCSACGFDFLGPDATLENLWDRTCNNDHVLGQDGVHAEMDGLARFYELSLVSIGAAKNAKIVGRAKQRLGQETYSQLAASGFDPELTALFAARTGHVTCNHQGGCMPPENKEVLGADALLAQFTTLAAEKGQLSAQLAAANASVTDLTAQLAAANTSVTDLTAKLAAAEKGLALSDEHTKLVAFFSDAVKAAMVASGVQNPQVPTTVEGLLAALGEAKHKLHNLPVGPQLEASGDPSTKNPAKTEGGPQLPASAFTAQHK